MISISLPDGRVFGRPVWHQFIDGRFVFQFPDGDRKIAMLERDPRATVILARGPHPYRAIEVRGRIRMTRDGYEPMGLAICGPYVAAFDAATDPSRVPEPDAGCGARHSNRTATQLLGLRRRRDDADRRPGA